jgi:hypothetical protein
MVEQLHEAIVDLIAESDCGLYEVVGVLEAIKHEILLETSLADDEDQESDAEACVVAE